MPLHSPSEDLARDAHLRPFVLEYWSNACSADNCGTAAGCYDLCTDVKLQPNVVAPAKRFAASDLPEVTCCPCVLVYRT